MVPLGMRRCLMAIAAVVAFFATQHAFAADQCVAELASLPDAASLGAAPDGDEPDALPGDALLIEGDKVPISLPIGASAIAPRLMRAIGDASIEAERACQGPRAGAHGVVSQDDRQDRAEPPLSGDACLPIVEALAPAVEGLLPPPSPLATAPARGVLSPIDRPPRR